MAQWYTRVSNGNPNTPTDYTPSGPTPPECPGTGKVCAIFAERDLTIPAMDKPEITEDLQQEITTALNQGVDTENVLLRSDN
ncbi:hypothetical protein [Pedobacter polysacchareus]|uniref:hypothetical protein n=1 Tax=Pedobacter polysacchareus TaxID=2861973 RepID=UPI001C9A0BBA|nr:hypothetical protein [Pedobacter polysacchareus]